jgi:AcrR family transcriptional regulator
VLDCAALFGQTLSMSNKNKRDEKRDAILLGAHNQFRIYGYRKTSMEDIARELGISRASLYSYFENKDEIFRSVSLHLHEEALTAAEKSLAGEWSNENASEKFVDALLARHLRFHEEQFQSSHATELQDEYSRLCGDVVVQSHRTFQMLLSRALNQASRDKLLDLSSRNLGAEQVAELLNFGVAGLKRGADKPGIFESRVGQFVKIFMRGLGHS